jgi:putative copper resistance protein D
MQAVKGSLDPGAVAMVTLALGLYLRAVRVLARRGYAVPRWQQAAWYAGMAFTGAGLLSPIDHYAEDLLSVHMAQHLLIADIAAPLLLTGLRTPVLVFMLPRPVLVPLARARWLRRAFRFLRQPLVALPVFMLVLYGWHFRVMFEGALRHDVVHVLQHMTFVGASVLVWWPALEPKRRHIPGELWKIGHIFAARMISLFLGMAFVFMRTPVYEGFYGDRARDYGLSPLQDQQLAGGLMMSLDVIVIMTALIIFFVSAARDHDRAEARAAT